MTAPEHSSLETEPHGNFLPVHFGKCKEKPGLDLLPKECNDIAQGTAQRHENRKSIIQEVTGVKGSYCNTFVQEREATKILATSLLLVFFF